MYVTVVGTVVVTVACMLYVVVTIESEYLGEVSNRTRITSKARERWDTHETTVVAAVEVVKTDAVDSTVVEVAT